MSLFICPECSTVENSNCLSPSFPYVAKEGCPDLSLMDMQIDHGHMLCSQCNTGHHHEEFSRDQATEAEQHLAEFSRFGMITPADHAHGVIIKDKDARYGYVVNPIIAIMREAVKKHLTEVGSIADRLVLMDDPELIKYHPLYPIYIQDMDNFDASCLRDLDLQDPRSIELSILDSQYYTPRESVYSRNSTSIIYHSVVNNNNMKKIDKSLSFFLSRLFKHGFIHDYITAYEHFLSQSKKKYLHNFSGQSAKEKASKLDAAELKRMKKALKKATNIRKTKSGMKDGVTWNLKNVNS